MSSNPGRSCPRGDPLARRRLVRRDLANVTTCSDEGRSHQVSTVLGDRAGVDTSNEGHPTRRRHQDFFRVRPRHGHRPSATPSRCSRPTSPTLGFLSWCDLGRARGIAHHRILPRSPIHNALANASKASPYWCAGAGVPPPTVHQHPTTPGGRRHLADPRPPPPPQRQRRHAGRTSAEIPDNLQRRHAS